jgi:hypothetical protein
VAVVEDELVCVAELAAGDELLLVPLLELLPQPTPKPVTRAIAMPVPADRRSASRFNR